MKLEPLGMLFFVLYGSRELIEPIGGQPHSGSTNGDQELDKHSEGLKWPLKLRKGGMYFAAVRLKADSTNRKRGESLGSKMNSFLKLGRRNGLE